jgi:hypothetical protein
MGSLKQKVACVGQILGQAVELARLAAQQPGKQIIANRKPFLRT